MNGWSVDGTPVQPIWVSTKSINRDEFLMWRFLFCFFFCFGLRWQFDSKCELFVRLIRTNYPVWLRGKGPSVLGRLCHASPKSVWIVRLFKRLPHIAISFALKINLCGGLLLGALVGLENEHFHLRVIWIRPIMLFLGLKLREYLIKTLSK